MSFLLAISLVLGAAAAKVESVQLSDTGARTAVRVRWTGAPAEVTLHREGNSARVTMSDAELGQMFGGGTRFDWSGASVPAGAPFQGLRIESRGGEVFFFFTVSADTPIDVQRGTSGMLVSFRQGGPPSGNLIASRPTAAPPRAPTMTPTPAPALPGAPTLVAAAPFRTAPPPPTTLAAAPVVTTLRAEPATPPVREAQTAPPPAPAFATADLHRSLFPVPTAEPQAEPQETNVPSTDLYGKLFPYAAEAPPTPAPATEATVPTAPEELEPGLQAGPFTVRPGIRVGYVDAQAYFLSTPEPVRDQYMEIQPKLEANASVGAGRFSIAYEPIVRALGSFPVTQSTSHPVQATLDVPLGTRGQLHVTDEFLNGVLETTEVDPGGEYFFDLGRFNKNAVAASASIDVGPRLSLEFGGGFDWVDFTEPSSFFGYQRAAGTVGLGFEATPTLKTIFSYAYDSVPPLDDRPEAEYRAHSLQVSLLGDILPLVRGTLTLGYRDQKNPNAAPGGERFQGFTAAGTLTKDFGPESAVTLLVSRATPISNFQQNGYYVSTAVSASFLAPLPYSIALNAGGGYHWNDYPTLITDQDIKREDQLFGWFVGLRRPLDRRTSLFAGYRWERRRSNIESFENDTDGFLVQLDVDVFGRKR